MSAPLQNRHDVQLACRNFALYLPLGCVMCLHGTQGAADDAVLPVTQRITASTCKLAYRLKSGGERPAGEQPLCSLKCSATGRHLVIAGSVAGTTARHVTLSVQREHHGSGAARQDSWSNSWEAARPLWVKVMDELARPLLADAARQGLCAPPLSLLALDAEALDNILQQLPVRNGPLCCRSRRLRVPLPPWQHVFPPSASHTMMGHSPFSSTQKSSRLCRRGTWPACPRLAASCAARRARTRCGNAWCSRTSRRVPAPSAAAAGRPSTGQPTGTGRRRASGGWRSAATRSCGRYRASAAATLSCRRLGLAASSVRAATRLKPPPFILPCHCRPPLEQANACMCAD